VRERVRGAPKTYEAVWHGYSRVAVVRKRKERMATSPHGRVVFFDLDGTLTDPMLGIVRSIHYALYRPGLDLPEDDLSWCIGPPLLESVVKIPGGPVRRYALRVSRVGSVRAACQSPSWWAVYSKRRWQLQKPFS